MESTIGRIRRIKVDALYGKKKHFNAAERLESMHFRVGVPLIVLNVLTSSTLFYVLTDGANSWVKFIPLVLSLFAAVLSGFQTYFNWPQKIEGHRKIGNKYLAVMKTCDRLQAYCTDGLLTANQIVAEVERVAKEAAVLNTDAESFPTNVSDYQLAKKSILEGEEHYTDSELEI